MEEIKSSQVQERAGTTGGPSFKYIVGARRRTKAEISLAAKTRLERFPSKKPHLRRVLGERRERSPGYDLMSEEISRDSFRGIHVRSGGSPGVGLKS